MSQDLTWNLLRVRILTTLSLSLLCIVSNSGWLPGSPQEQRPNIIILFADDLGYGDLGAFGHPTIRTPNLDRMASEGMKWTQFYVGASVCSPSRAALLTGRLPIRSGMAGETRHVFFPNSAGGLPQEELTLAEALKEQEYATACIGKWHLGHLPRFLPTEHGFDYYFGLPYSNDMHVERRGDPPVPLLRNKEIIEQPVQQETLTARYTEEALQFIRRNRDQPFLLYLPYTFPHVPLFASDRFLGRSPRGLYGDVVEEIDWSVGRITSLLRELNLHERTLVVFTSDNGPWLTEGLEGGSAGLLRNGKGSTWEGGMRVPCITWWPGNVPAGRVNTTPATTMDLFATAVDLAGGELASDRTYDGVSLKPLLRGSNEAVRDVVFFYRGTQLRAVRHGPWKAHFVTQEPYSGQPPEHHDPPLLYQLDKDPSEVFNVAAEHPEALTEIRKIVDEHEEGLVPVESQLEALISD